MKAAFRKMRRFLKSSKRGREVGLCRIKHIALEEQRVITGYYGLGLIRL
jgi:hypothetical protein